MLVNKLAVVAAIFGSAIAESSQTTHDPSLPLYAPGYFVTNSFWTGTDTRVWIIEPSGSVAGTVITLLPVTSEVPSGYIATRATWTGTETVVSTIAPEGTASGSIITYVPEQSEFAPGYHFSLTTWTGTYTAVSTIEPYRSIPGTIVTYLPGSLAAEEAEDITVTLASGEAQIKGNGAESSSEAESVSSVSSSNSTESSTITAYEGSASRLEIAILAGLVSLLILL